MKKKKNKINEDIVKISEILAKRTLIFVSGPIDWLKQIFVCQIQAFYKTITQKSSNSERVHLKFALVLQICSLVTRKLHCFLAKQN